MACPARSTQFSFFPWHGHGSALLHPAGIGLTNHAFLQVGRFASVGGKDIHRVYQAAVATGDLLPIRISAGLGGYSNGSAIDGSNALYMESYYAPAIAIATPEGGLPGDREGFLLPRAYSALLTWTSPGSLTELHAEYQFTAWDSK